MECAILCLCAPAITNMVSDSLCDILCVVKDLSILLLK